MKYLVIFGSTLFFSAFLAGAERRTWVRQPSFSTLECQLKEESALFLSVDVPAEIQPILQKESLSLETPIFGSAQSIHEELMKSPLFCVDEKPSYLARVVPLLFDVETQTVRLPSSPYEACKDTDLFLWFFSYQKDMFSPRTYRLRYGTLNSMSALGNHILGKKEKGQNGCTCKTSRGEWEWKPHDVVSIIYSILTTKSNPGQYQITGYTGYKRIQQRIFSYFMNDEGISLVTSPALLKTADTLYSVSRIKTKTVKSRVTSDLMQVLSRMEVGKLYPALGKAESWGSERELWDFDPVKLTRLNCIDPEILVIRRFGEQDYRAAFFKVNSIAYALNSSIFPHPTTEKDYCAKGFYQKLLPLLKEQSAVSMMEICEMELLRMRGYVNWEPMLFQ